MAPRASTPCATSWRASPRGPPSTRPPPPPRPRGPAPASALTGRAPSSAVPVLRLHIGVLRLHVGDPDRHVEARARAHASARTTLQGAGHHRPPRGLRRVRGSLRGGLRSPDEG